MCLKVIKFAYKHIKTTLNETAENHEIDNEQGE